MLITNARKEVIHRIIRGQESSKFIYDWLTTEDREKSFWLTRARNFASQFENRSQGDLVACFPSTLLVSVSRFLSLWKRETKGRESRNDQIESVNQYIWSSIFFQTVLAKYCIFNREESVCVCVSISLFY